MNRMAKIGAFAVVVLVLLAFFILRIERLNLFGEAGPTRFVHSRNASKNDPQPSRWSLAAIR